MIEDLSDGVLVLDLADRIVDINPAASRMFGVNAEVVGQPVDQALPLWGVLVETLPELGQGQVAVPGMPPRYLDVRLSALPGRGRQRGRLVVLRDITDYKQLEKMRTDLLNMIVHDLRNPLTNIMVALETLDFDPQTPPPDAPLAQVPALEIAHASAEQMLELVSSILDITRLERGQMVLECVTLDVSQLAREAVQAAAAQAAERQVQLESVLPTELPFVQADAGLIRRVLQNLLGNALKFTPAGGQVHVSAWSDLDQAAVVVAVADTGLGIPPDAQPRLFQMFTPGRGRGSGSGIGLAFCRLALEAHGGQIWVESVPGQGATFFFRLPVPPSGG